MSLPSHRGLFVIGVARSGTTILQNALNHAPDIYLLGEPDLHMEEEGAPGFADRFDAMHEGWRNQPTKSSRMPRLLDEDGDWRAYFDRLAEHHRWVGTKIVVNPGHSPEWLDRLERFQARHFYDARYLFVFRRPDAVVKSYRGMQEAMGEAPGSAAPTLANYAETVALFTRMVRTFPHVLGLVHEDIGEATFEGIGEWLGSDLAGAASYYDTARIRAHGGSAGGQDDLATQMSLLYDELRTMLGGPLPRPQIEQNDGNFDPAHYTALGSIDRRARFLRACFAGG